MPATASAAVLTGSCGSTIQGTPGDAVHVDPSSLFGLKPGSLPILDLGLVTQGTKTLTGVPVLGPLLGGLLNKICSVTVVGVNTVVAPVEAGASTVNKAVTNTVNTITQAAGGATGQPSSGGPTGGTGAPGSAPSGGAPGNAPVGGQNPGSPTIPGPNSPVLGGETGFGYFGGLPLDFAGYSPMRDYSTIPMAMAGVYSPSPGLRYGGEIPGYAPEFGLPGDSSAKQGNGGIQNAGQAEALPVGGNLAGGVGIPVLMAVLLLSGVSAGLVRTWVLRRTAATV
jgi:hypothetical protein